MADLVKVEAEIISAIEAVRALGWRIVRGVTVDEGTGPGRGDRCCCALGAVLVRKGGDALTKGVEHAGQIVGLSPREAQALAAGFDGGLDRVRHAAVYSIGERLAERYALNGAIIARTCKVCSLDLGASETCEACGAIETSVTLRRRS